MHELTIAQNIIRIVHDELEKIPGTKIVECVRFRAGRLNAIIPESLKFNFDILKKDYPMLDQANLEVAETPVIIRCRQCQAEAAITEPLFLCAACGSVDLQMISGQEMFVDSIEVKQTDQL